MDVTVQDNSWDPIGPEDDRFTHLMTTLHVNGIAHHLEAVEVKDSSPQKVANKECQRKLDAMDIIATPEEPFQTTSIAGKEYVLLMVPHCG